MEANVGADLRVCPKTNDGNKDKDEHTGSPLQKKTMKNIRLQNKERKNYSFLRFAQNFLFFLSLRYLILENLPKCRKLGIVPLKNT